MQTRTVCRGARIATETVVNQGPETRVVLVVTGDADLREASARVLAREGYEVVTAAHAGHAVLACITARRVDLLVAELAMEDVSGPALFARLRRQFPELAAVYVARAGAQGCDGVLVRPFTREDLLSALTKARATSDANLTSAF